MTDNVALLLTVLVAANVILITLAVVRAWRRRRQEARFLAARSVPSGDVLRPSGCAPVVWASASTLPTGPGSPAARTH